VDKVKKRFTQAELKKMGKEAAALYTKLRNILGELATQDNVDFYAYFEEGCYSKEEFLGASSFRITYQPPQPAKAVVAEVKEK
jgi:hypothetical protein